MSRSLYVITWAGAHSDRLRSDGPYPTIAAAMAAIRLVCAASPMVRRSICRSSEHDDGWTVYARRSDRDYDRYGDAPGLAIALIERAPMPRAMTDETAHYRCEA